LEKKKASWVPEVAAVGKGGVLAIRKRELEKGKGGEGSKESGECNEGRVKPWPEKFVLRNAYHGKLPSAGTGGEKTTKEGPFWVGGLRPKKRRGKREEGWAKGDPFGECFKERKTAS